MSKAKLSGKTGAALDPCAALQSVFDLAEDEEHEIIFRMGPATIMHHASQLVQQFRTVESRSNALEESS